MKRAILDLGVRILVAAAGVGLARAETVDYHADVAPLMRDYCAGCHNDFDLEGEFSVETFAALMKGGETKNKPIVVPGKPGESYLLQTITRMAKPAMPPKKEPQLSEDEVDVIVRWIEQGAKGPAPDKDLSILSTLNVPDVAATGKAAEPITATAVSPDGKLLATARYEKVELRDAAGGKALREIQVPGGKVNAVHFSPDGDRLVTASGISGLRGFASVWEVASGKLVCEIGAETHRDILYDAEFSPDGSLLATAGYDRTIRLWEAATGKFVREFPSHNAAIYDLAFSPDGTVLASASGDSTSKIWKVASGERLDTLNQPQGEQFRIDFTPDGNFIVGAGADNRIRLWRFLSKDRPRINPVVHSRYGHEDAIVELAVSADGKTLLTASADRALKRWSLPGLELVEVLGEQPDVVSSLAFLSGGKGFSAARMDGTVATFQLGEPGAAAPGKGAGGEKAPVAGGTAPDLESIALGGEKEGAIATAGEADEFLFQAKKGETWIFEVNAARSKSKLDSHLAILDAAGNPVERVVLQAVRDSWLTFRGKDSATSGDFRVHNWREMELNELLYVNGEVIKLWHYPRGPDSGFLVYPGFGSRHTFFETTPLAHPLGQPCHIVRAFPAGSDPNPNGLPVYRLHYENDDESSRRLGKDSKLTFPVPADGLYRVRLSDVRGFGGEGFTYRLAARVPKPGFSVSVGGKNPKISPGSARELTFTATRDDGFEGPIEIRVSGLPESLSFPEVVTIEERQFRAFAPIRAKSDFAGLSAEDSKKIVVSASAMIAGSRFEKKIGDLGTLEKGPDAKVLVAIEPDGESGRIGKDGVLEFTVTPGETITARAVAQRLGFDGRIDFGKEDSGRNLPHGVYVDNIGLNGLMIPVGKSEQRFFVTAAKWVPETVREFHLRATADGNQVSIPVRLRVVKPDGERVAEARR